VLTCAGVYSREQWQHVTSLLPAVRTSAARSSASSKSPILLDETDDADTTDDRDPLARRLEFPTPALTNARSNLLPPLLEDEEADEGGMASAIEINSSSSPSIHGDAEPLEVVADYDDDVIEYDEPTDLDHATPSPAAGVRGEQEFLYLDPSAIHVADAQPESPIAEKTILELHDLSPEKAADTSSLIEQDNCDDEAIEDANAHILKQLIGVLNDVPPIIGDSRGVVLSAHDNENDEEDDDNDTTNVTANQSSIVEPQATDSSRTFIEIADDADETETEIDADEPVVVVHAQPNEFGSPQARPASAVASAESACRSPASESDVGSSSFLSCVEDEDISIDLSGQDDDEDNSERGAPARATPNSSALEATEKSGAVVVDVDDQPADNDGNVTDADVSGVDHDTAADDAAILDGLIKDAAFESRDVADTDTETDCDSDEHEHEADDSIFFDDDQDATHTDSQASRHETATAAPLVVPTIAVAAPADSDTDTDTDVESEGERSPDVFVTPATSLRSTKRRIIVSPEPSPVDSLPTQQQSRAVMATPLVSARTLAAVASSVRTRRRIIVTPESSPEVVSPAAGSFSIEPLSPEEIQVAPVQPELEDISAIDEIQVAPVQPELEDISTIDEIQVAPVQPELEDISAIDEIQVAPVQPELEDISAIDEIQVAPVQPELEVAKVQVPQPPAVEPAPARATVRQRVPSLAGAKPANTDFQDINANDQSLPPIVAPSAARESVGAVSIRAAAKRRLLSRRQMTTFVDEGPSTPSSRATPAAPARKAQGSLAPSKRQLATPAAAEPPKPRALPKSTPTLSATPSVSDLLSSDSSDDDNDTEADTATNSSENAEPEMMLLPIGARKPQPVGTVRSAMPSKLVPFYNLLLDKNPELSAKYSNIRTFAREREPLARSLYAIFNHAVFNDLLPEDMELQLYVPHL